MGFVAGYLQCRLARETGGEVVIESLSLGDRWGQVPAPRMMTMTLHAGGHHGLAESLGTVAHTPDLTGKGRAAVYSIK